MTDLVAEDLVKKVVYTIGHDQIAQTTFTPGGDPEGDTLVFHMDGHGSTRILTNLAATIATYAGFRQIFHFDAYGNAIGFNPTQALTAFLYNSEHFDVNTGGVNLRARIYYPWTGTFDRRDDFTGNMRDPQSLHKHLFTHADPVNGIDPTGNFLAAVSIAIASGISSLGRSYNFASIAAYSYVSAWAMAYPTITMLGIYGLTLYGLYQLLFDPEARDVFLAVWAGNPHGTLELLADDLVTVHTPETHEK